MLYSLIHYALGCYRFLCLGYDPHSDVIYLDLFIPSPVWRWSPRWQLLMWVWGPCVLSILQAINRSQGYCLFSTYWYNTEAVVNYEKMCARIQDWPRRDLRQVPRTVASLEVGIFLEPSWQGTASNSKASCGRWQ